MNVNDTVLRSAGTPVAISRSAERVRLAAPSAYALSALSALLYATGFPPLAWTLAPWLALAPVLFACATLPPARAALAGVLWAATAAAALAWFLPGMLSGFFGLGTLPSWLATIVVVGVLHGIWLGAYAAWVAWLARLGAANPLLLAGGWLACELARAESGLSSGWALSAYSQVRWTPVIQIADLAGPYGIGLLIGGVNAVAAAALAPALRGRRPWRSAATIAAALLATLLYGEWRLDQRFDDGDALRVAVVQAGAAPAEKSRRAQRLARYVALTRADADAAGGLVVWPEYATEAYLDEPSPARAAILGAAADLRADLILGGPHYALSPAGTRYHNSAYLIRDARVAGRYDKHRLVPFAEDGRLAWLHHQPSTAYSAGTGSFIVRGTEVRAGMLLCVEAMYGDLVRQAVREGAEVLVNLSNDAWFGHAEPARQQLDIATLRAVESRRYLLRAAATGFSAVVDPHGRTLAESGFDTYEVLNATVHGSRAVSPYQRWGDAFAWLVVTAVAAASLRARRDAPARQHPKEDRMNRPLSLTALAIGVALAATGTARAGAPQPDQRQGDFVHVCAGGANKDQACSVATQDVDCPKSECIVQTLSQTIKGTMTIIAHDEVTDWSTGGAGNRALTVMLEVKAPDGSKQILAATYQDLATPTDPPTAPGSIVAIGMDEPALKNLATAVNGLLFVQPQSTLSQQLQTLFNTTGTPALVAVNERKVDVADHSGDGLASVLRFKVKIQFLSPA